jgi:hypothetical protein
MTMILVRKHTAKPVFHPHYNTATGRYYGTAREYIDDLKAKGLEPVKDVSEHPEPMREKRGPSPWARSMVETIKLGKREDGSVRLGSRFYDELNKRGVKARPCH